MRDQNITDKDYAECVKVWKDNNMKTLREFLVFYNNKDVGPFIQALDTQTKFYKEHLKLDMLKNGKSIPGLTMRYLYKTIPKDMYFSLINDQHKDLHALIRDQMVGGPSIIFNRYMEKNETYIRGGDKLVETIMGKDANALYLAGFLKPQPTGHPIRRRKENKFRAEKVDVYGRQAREWLEWISYKENKFIRHKFNGHEKTFGQNGKVRVDGWDASGTAYQFHVSKI